MIKDHAEFSLVTASLLARALGDALPPARERSAPT